MFLKVNDAIKGLKHFSAVVASLKEATLMPIPALKQWLNTRKYTKALTHYLRCSLPIMASMHDNMKHTHVEVLAHHGIFIARSKALEQSYPRITVLDTSQDSFDNLSYALRHSLSPCHFIHFNPSTDPVLTLSEPLNSVGLPFVLEKLPNKESMREFLGSFAQQIEPRQESAIFGMCAIFGTNAKSRNLQKKYVEWLQTQGYSYNQNLTTADLAEVLEAHFSNVTLYQQGNCVLFCAYPPQEKVTRKPILPKEDPLKIPYDTYYS